MVYKTNYSWEELAFFAVLAFVMGVFFLAHADPEAGIPARSELASAKGQLAWMEPYKYGTRFALVGIAEKFDYPSQASGSGDVRRALERAGIATVSIEYSVDVSKVDFHDVWVLDVGDRTIRSFAQTRAGWESNNRAGRWFGVATLAFAFFAGRHARRGYRAAFPRRTPLMNFRIEHDDAKRESFSEYKYRIYKDDQLVADYWHDYRGDDHGIEFVDGRSEMWPVGNMTDFLAGGGPQPVALTARAVAYLTKRCR